MDLQQFLDSHSIAILSFISGGAGGYFLAKFRTKSLVAEIAPSVVREEYVQPPKVALSSLERKHRLMLWRDQFQVELESVITDQVKKIDDALSDKSTWWGLFKMKTAAEALNEVVTTAFVAVQGITDSWIAGLVDKECCVDKFNAPRKFDPTALNINLDAIRFLPLNRDKIRECVKEVFLGADGVQVYYVHQSNQLVKKACAQL